MLLQRCRSFYETLRLTSLLRISFSRDTRSSRTKEQHRRQSLPTSPSNGKPPPLLPHHVPHHPQHPRTTLPHLRTPLSATSLRAPDRSSCATHRHRADLRLLRQRALPRRMRHGLASRRAARLFLRSIPYHYRRRASRPPLV